jgi:hypothetical protein
VFQKLAHIICIVISTITLNAQNGIFSSPDWYIKPAINQGVVLEHRSTIGHLIKGYPTMYELNVVKPTIGNRMWHHENNFPDLGLSFNVIDFKNPKELGYSFSIAPFAEIPLNKKQKVSRLIFRLSWGLAYFNKKFDVETNHKNIAIGSHFNSYVQFKWFWQLQLNDKIRLEPGFSFTHASNAKMKTPNLGLNVGSINLAINFKHISKKNKITTPVLPDSTKLPNTPRHELFIWQTIGINDREPSTDKKRLTLTTSFGYYFNKRNTHKFGLGADIFYDENMIDDLNFDNLPTNTVADVLRGGPKLCYAYNLGQITFPVEMGFYIKNPYTGDGLFFHRIGVRYLSKKGIMGLVNLRTHWGVAYSFEFGMGYRWGIGKKRNT